MSTPDKFEQDFEYANEEKYPTPRLRLHLMDLQHEERGAVAHRAEFINKALGYAAYELVMRDLEVKHLEEKLEPTDQEPCSEPADSIPGQLPANPA